ncbi:MAG: alpha/beta fold hydrolase, partial [Flavobacteriaceae bacterium]|nr:alpha/beta fold hydrolase [Flavobacteriaceae bacterium]
QRLALSDGDFLDLDIASVRSKSVVIAIHGLEGSSRSPYIVALTAFLNRNQLDVIALNLRGCSGESNKVLSSYHSGKTDDLQAVLEHVEKNFDYRFIHIVGYSLGGNITIKYMGEFAASQSGKLVSATGVSVPCDLGASSEKINDLSNRVYLNMFMKSLKAKALEKCEQFPQSPLDKNAILKSRNFRDFDNCYTAPVNGFKDAEDYWEQSSCKQFIPLISKPTLLLSALDDPFLNDPCFPFEEAAKNERFYFKATTKGGHVGFNEHFIPNKNLWSERVICSFIKEQENSR